jgi:enoyl-CoA hydratase/carnithine racemase
MESIEKPVIVAANGPCLGAGTEMAVSCDFRFCTPETHRGLPETRSEGAIPGSGGVSRLTRLVGTHWAKWMALAARNVSADDARMMGLVHRSIRRRAHGAGVRFAAVLTRIEPRPWRWPSS